MTRAKPLQAIVSIGLAALLQVGTAQAGAIIEGTWLTVSKSEITIESCELGFCGRISKIEVPPEVLSQYADEISAMQGNFKDEMNKEAALRERPILDLPILTLRAGANPWIYDGEIYNPRDGNIYSGYVEVIGADTLKLNGCVLYNLVCSGEEWIRVIVPPEAEGAPEGDAASAQ